MGPWGLFIDGIIHGIVNDYYNDSWLMGVVNHDGITKYYKWDCKSFFFVWLGCKCSDFTIFHFTTNDDHGIVNEDFEFIHGVNAGESAGGCCGILREYHRFFIWLGCIVCSSQKKLQVQYKAQIRQKKYEKHLTCYTKQCDWYLCDVDKQYIYI